MSRIFSRRGLTIGAFGVITVACTRLFIWFSHWADIFSLSVGLSIGRDIRQYMNGSKTPQEPLATPLVTSSPLTKAQETHPRQLTNTDIARYYTVSCYWMHNPEYNHSLQEQRSLLQRERDDLAKKISHLEQRIAANKN